MVIVSLISYSILLVFPSSPVRFLLHIYLSPLDLERDEEENLKYYKMVMATKPEPAEEEWRRSQPVTALLCRESLYPEFLQVDKQLVLKAA